MNATDAFVAGCFLMAHRHSAVVSTGNTSIRCSIIASASSVLTKTVPTTCDVLANGLLAALTSNHKYTLAQRTANGKNAFMRRRLKKLCKYAK